MDATSRAVMRALVCRGHYPETPDGFARAVVDAQDIVATIRESNGGPTQVAYTIRMALHPLGPSGPDDCLLGDQDAVWEAFHQTERNVA